MNRFISILKSPWPLVVLLVIATTMLTGCQTPTTVAVGLSHTYRPDNVFQATNQLPSDLKRVAVLPIACDGQRTDLASGREALSPTLLAELTKAKRFEVVSVSRDELQHLSGQPELTADETLPANFLNTLQKKYGCDAVLFPELTDYHAYPPLAIGWRLTLVDVDQKKVIWESDEHFDAGEPSVIAAAEHYQQGQQRQLGDDTVSWLAVYSPRWFGEYSLASLVDTLPNR
jgi:hypothetical protein